MSKRKKKKKPNSNALQKTAVKQEVSSESVGLLVTTAREYHLRYAEEIAYEIEFHKHLSILMPAMIGLYPLPLLLYDGLDFRCREYIIVENQDDIKTFNNMLISKQEENKCIYPVLFDDFIKRNPTGGCYVLFDLSQEKRMMLLPVLSAKKDTAVISIGKLRDETVNAKSSLVSQAQSAMVELYQITTKDGRPHCMIFPVDSVLDIRDLMYAGASEKSRLVSALYNICSDYEVDYGVTDKFTNSTGNAEKIALYNRMLAERDFEIAILKAVAATAGVDMSGLEKGISRISEMKYKFAEKYDQTADPLEQEKLESSFQNEVSEMLVTVTNNMMTLANRDSYEKVMIYQLGERVWNELLSARSRTYLISAMMTFDSMNKMGDRNVIDYSGVCLQVTKVLDEEMAVRFFTMYKRYLYKNYLLDDWPQAMKTKYGDEPLPSNDFTLGSIAHVIGVGVRGRIYDSIAYEQVQGFAKNCLYKDGMTDQEVRDHLIKCVECAEKTRKDYRNPAAHREAMSYISAKECIDYLIEQTKMLKQILQDMKV